MQYAYILQILYQRPVLFITIEDTICQILRKLNDSNMLYLQMESLPLFLYRDIIHKEKPGFKLQLFLETITNMD